MKSLFISLFVIFFLYPAVAQEQKLSSTEQSSHDFEIAKSLDIYVNLFKELNTYYVDEIDPAALIKTSINAMLRSLDPYTVYYPESDVSDFRFMTSGNYGGIGAIIGTINNQVIVSEPYKGFPADKAGLKAGDIILKIDDKDVSGFTSDDISNLLRGQAGTNVKLFVHRPVIEKDMEFNLIREKIQIENVPYYSMLNDSIGYVKLQSFKNNAANDVKKAILELKKSNNLKGLVFDLRGNPGGLLVEAVKLAGLFVDRGELIVSTKGKVRSWNKEYKTWENPIARDLPLVVLINGGSASASEIVAGSLQDLDRAVIMGSRSYGKGLVQTTRKLSFNSQMKVTTSKYYIPSGRCIQEVDYSHHDKNNRPIKVADSLTHEFKTRNGRIVKDGKGILPDMQLNDEDFPEILQVLARNNLIFDYATIYYHNHDSIAGPENFSLSETDYNAFKDYVLKSDLKKKSTTENNLEKLDKLAQKDGYYEMIKEDLENIKSKLKTYYAQELEKQEALIRKYLEQEIIARYYYQDGQTRYALNKDKDVKAALELFSDTPKFNELLSGK